MNKNYFYHFRPCLWEKIPYDIFNNRLSLKMSTLNNNFFALIVNQFNVSFNCIQWLNKNLLLIRKNKIEGNFTRVAENCSINILFRFFSTLEFFFYVASLDAHIFLIYVVGNEENAHKNCFLESFWVFMK